MQSACSKSLIKLLRISAWAYQAQHGIAWHFALSTGALSNFTTNFSCPLDLALYDLGYKKLACPAYACCMIVLQSEVSEGDTESASAPVKLVRYHLKPGTHSVGRRTVGTVCDGRHLQPSSICLLEDKLSISRDHAVLTVFGLKDELAHNGQVAILRGKPYTCVHCLGCLEATKLLTCQIADRPWLQTPASMDAQWIRQ